LSYLIRIKLIIICYLTCFINLFNETVFLLLCTIYFVDIGTFIRGMPPPPPYVDEEMMPEAAVGQGPRVEIPDGIHCRLDTRLKVDLGD
jgi:hypothetical protein